MERNYPVFFGNEQAGKVSVQRQGLYYRFRCRCRITGSEVYRIRVRCGGKQENLGIPVPVEGGFGLDTQLPVKRLGEGDMEFFLVPKGQLSAAAIAPVYPEEPFAYIARLKDAYLVRQNGIIGIGIK